MTNIEVGIMGRAPCRAPRSLLHVIFAMSALIAALTALLTQIAPLDRPAKVTVGRATWPPRVLMESSIRPGVSTHWIQSSRASGPVSVHLVFAPSASQLDGLEHRLWAVSDPQSAEYGQHLSQGVIDGMVSPTTSAINTVSAWLNTAGLQAQAARVRSLRGDVMPLQLDAAMAERLFHTTLHTYTQRGRDPDATSIVRASTGYSLPTEVAQHILLIADLHGFPTPTRPLEDVERLVEASDAAADDDEADEEAGDEQATKAATAWPNDCGKCDNGLLGKHISPAVLAKRYGIPVQERSPVGHAGSIGVAEFQGVYFDQGDLDGYAKTCGLPGINLTLVGPNRPRSCHIPIIIKPDSCTEALLDIQVIKGIGASLPLTDVSSKGYSIVGWATQLQAMAEDDLPLVHSVSYGNDEAQQASAEYMQAVNTQLMKLGVRGRSVFFASGDGGVEGRRGSSRRFAAGFPASSPYATAVGGTDFAVKNVIGEEVAWTGSGGGFSYQFRPPAYQTAAVAAYFQANASGMPDASKYNASGRGFPDVSALGGAKNRYCIYSNGKNKVAYGTSASTPVIAAMTAKLNAIRIGNGKPPLGFVNPLFYQHPEAFQDVTKGCNCGKVYDGCSRGGIGFPATKGWDPVTGLGTPDWDKLAALM